MSESFQYGSGIAIMSCELEAEVSYFIEKTDNGVTEPYYQEYIEVVNGSERVEYPIWFFGAYWTKENFMNTFGEYATNQIEKMIIEQALEDL